MLLNLLLVYLLISVIDMVLFVYKRGVSISPKNYDSRIVQKNDKFIIQLKHIIPFVPFFRFWSNYKTSEGRLKDLYLQSIKKYGAQINSSFYYTVKQFNSFNDAQSYISGTKKS